MSNRLVKIGAAAQILGTTPGQLRKWEKTGELLPTRRTRGGTRYYAVSDLSGITDETAPTVCYARVSSYDQKADLDRQQAVLEAYCAAKGWRTEVIRDLGSGMNYNKKGLQRLLELILRRQLRRLVLTHKDRLLRFGADLVFSLCELQGALRSSSFTRVSNRALKKSWPRTYLKSLRYLVRGSMELVPTIQRGL